MNKAGLLESAAMKLSELVEGVSGASVRGDPGTEITGLAYHTRDVADGTLFFCVPGLSFDGHAFAAAAVEAGAAALVCERDTGVSAPQVVVPSVRRAMALAAARWYGDPSRDLRVVGVTGTNGKTTTAHLVAGLFAAAGEPSGLLGTVVNRIGGVEHPVRLTTAESLDLQRMFREMVEAGDEACAFEVSSHALAQDRAAGIDFDAVVFSNLTRDHLDYHKDLEDYFGAKRRLFLPDEGRNGDAVAVVNVATSSARASPASAGRSTATTCGPARSTRRAPPAPPSSPAICSCAPTAPPSRSSARGSGSTSASRCASRRASTSRTPSPRRRPGWPSGCPPRPSCAASASPRASPAASRRCAPGSRSASSSTTRTRPTRSRTRSRRRAP